MSEVGWRFWAGGVESLREWLPGDTAGLGGLQQLQLQLQQLSSSCKSCIDLAGRRDLGCLQVSALVHPAMGIFNVTTGLAVLFSVWACVDLAS